MDNITDKLNALKNTSVEDITGLPHTSYLDKNTLPSIPAIYFLVVNNFIVYIGKTFDLNNRWRIHHLSQYIHSFLFATKIIEQTSCNIYYIDYSVDTPRPKGTGIPASQRDAAQKPCLCLVLLSLHGLTRYALPPVIVNLHL